MFENHRSGRQARNFTTNVPKILDLKSSSEQIFSENWRWVPLIFALQKCESAKSWFDSFRRDVRWSGKHRKKTKRLPIGAEKKTFTQFTFFSLETKFLCHLQHWHSVAILPCLAVFCGLSLKAGMGNVGMGMGNGESLKWGIFKSGNL